MDSVKFPRWTTRIVEVEEYLKRLGATASAEIAKEVVTGLSSGINEAAVLENNVVDEFYEFDSAPKTQDAATQTKWPNLGNRKQTMPIWLLDALWLPQPPTRGAGRTWTQSTMPSCRH